MKPPKVQVNTPGETTYGRVLDIADSSNQLFSVYP
jgi:hypothetical protein